MNKKNKDMNKNMKKGLDGRKAAEARQQERQAEEIAARVDELEIELSVAMLRHARGKMSHIVALMALAGVAAQTIAAMQECGIVGVEKTFRQLLADELKMKNQTNHTRMKD